MTYLEMMQSTAETMNRKRFMVSVPFITITFSKRWVSTFSGVSIDLVGLLIDSLKHDLTVDKNPLQDSIKNKCISLKKSISSAIDEKGFPIKNPRQSFRRIDQKSKTGSFGAKTFIAKGKKRSMGDGRISAMASKDLENNPKM